MAISDPLVGQQLSSFRIERLLGRGGMAKVYYGIDEKLQRPVAIKVIDDRYKDHPAFVGRFLREARTVAAWQHPNILQIYHAGEEDGVLYYVMEYVRGMNLEQIIHKHRSRGELLPYAEVLFIGSSVANALDYAHRKGVVHRDVKPSNVLVSEEGRVALADFGLAMNVAQGTQGEVFGSPQYIAPEQARSSARAVPQSDIYSLGVMLYEMLTGSLPFNDPSPASLALKHITQEPPPPRAMNPDLSLAVEAVLLKALRKNPEDRYTTGSQMMGGLEDALLNVSPGTIPTPPSVPQELRGQPSLYTSIPREVTLERVVLHPTEQRDQEIGRLVWANIGCAAIILITAIWALSALINALSP
jgi:serine/threonine protein kinase